ncbi:hypothetical protein [Corynebacterium glucuronolyticum]|uniref:hypothetical protein n=1 Tax=Corynebacterium glucuronolyticum TaxID=39791 RepID=UPI001E480CAA|nr:hypothetical protein [Corynebacterium glucuronolyticum]
MSILNFAQWFLFLPGVLVHRDMVVVDHPALSAWNFGTAPGVAARNAPQDGVLALVGLVSPPRGSPGSSLWPPRSLVA